MLEIVIEISHKKAEEHTRQHLDYKKFCLDKAHSQVYNCY